MSFISLEIFSACSGSQLWLAAVKTADTHGNCCSVFPNIYAWISHVDTLLTSIFSSRSGWRRTYTNTSTYIKYWWFCWTFVWLITHRNKSHLNAVDQSSSNLTSKQAPLVVPWCTADINVNTDHLRYKERRPMKQYFIVLTVSQCIAVYSVLTPVSWRMSYLQTVANKALLPI